MLSIGLRRRLFSTVKNSPVETRPRQLRDVIFRLKNWLDSPQKWTDDQRATVMNTLFQTYDADPSSINPAPFLERWRQENGHVESEAASIYQKFRFHESALVASILLRTRLQFVKSANQVMTAATEIISRHPQNAILYSILLQRLTEVDNSANYIMQVLEELKSRQIQNATICFNIALQYFYKDSEAVFKIIAMMKDMKNAAPPDAKTYEQLVHTYLHSNNSEAAENAARKIKNDPKVLAQATLQILKHYRDIVSTPAISITNKHKAVQSAAKLCDGIIPLVSKDSKDRFWGVLMDTHVNMGDTNCARKIFEQLDQPSPDKIVIMIKAAIREGDFETARRYFEKQPDIPQFIAFVAACTDAPDGLSQAIALFEDFPDIPNISCYNALLNCANHHDANVAIEVLESLPFPPDKITFDLAMRTCFELKQHERASHFLNVMKEAGFEPDSWNYVQMLKLIETPEKREKYLLENVPNPNIYCYNVVLQAWVADRKYAELIKMLDLMRDQGVTFDVSTYNCTIFDLSKSGQHEYVNRADEMLQQMQENCQSKPSVAHYEAVMKGWCDLGDANRATKVLIRRIEATSNDKSLEPVAANFHQVTLAWMRANQPDTAAVLLLRFYDFVEEKILSRGPDERTRRMVASLLARQQKPEVLSLVTQLNKRKVPTDEKRLSQQ